MDKYLELGDPAFNTWVLAWDVHSLTTDPINLFNTNIFYPFTKNTLAFSEHLIADMLVAFPIIMITHNPILAYNLILVISFILSGFGVFLLIKYYLNDNYSAFIGGAIFAFCIIRFAHFGHLQLLTAQWIPFVLLYLDKFLREADYKNLIFLYIFYVLQILSSWYLAFYITISIGVYALCVFMIDKETRKNLYQHPYQMKLILFLICTISSVAPFAIPYLQIAQEYGFIRTLGEVSSFSADIGDYFLTPINNLVYGRSSYPFQVNRNTAEHSMFPGMSAIILSIYGLFLLSKIEFNKKNKLALIIISNKIQTTYLILALIAFILSLGYPLHFFGHVLNIDLPYKYLFEYFPGFKSMRVPSRFGFIVMLSLSVLAGYGMNKFIKSKSNIKKTAISSIVLLIIIIESTNIPLCSDTMPIGQEIPDVYKWLANEKGDFAIAEIPSDIWSDTKYMYFSTYHWKKLINGYSGFFPDFYLENMSAIMSFPSLESIDRLNTIGAKYLIVHKKDMNGLGWNCSKIALEDYNGKVHLKKIFQDDYVYEINNTVASNAHVYKTSGLYTPENWAGIPTRWMQADSTIMILSPANGTFNLSLQALGFYQNRTLKIYSGNTLMARISVPLYFTNLNVPIILEKGSNTLRMHVPEGCERPCDKPELNNPDSRCLSVAIQNVTIYRAESK
ncbi:MAG: hypothetical protein AB9879_04710 [Methanothrix sp.]